MTEPRRLVGADLPELCPWCGDPYDPHIFVATEVTPMCLPDGSLIEVSTGGFVLCPEDGCSCSSTWSLGIRGRDARHRP